MDRRTFGEICRVRDLCWGAFITEYMTPHTVRTFARAGYDWLWLDNEHSHHSYESIQEVIRCAEDLGVITLVRVTQGMYHLIARALDLGAAGIIVPRVETPEQVRAIVECAKYSPVGKRGFGIRPNLFAKPNISMKERIEDQNENRFLIIQVESQLGVDNLEALLEAGSGYIDAVAVGPADFQVDIGKPDQPQAPELEQAMRRVAEVCATREVSACANAHSQTDARLWVERGFNLLTYGSDHGFLANAAAEARQALRQLE